MNGIWRYENEPSRIEINNSSFKAVYERMEMTIHGRLNWLEENMAMLTITGGESALTKNVIGDKLRLELIEVTDYYLQLRIAGQCIYVVKVLDYKTYDKWPCRDSLPFIKWRDTPSEPLKMD